MSTTDAHALIIKNFSMLEDINKVYMDKIGPDIFKELDRLIEDILKDNIWIGAANIWDDDDLWFTSTSWKTIDNNDEYKASYLFKFVKDGKITDTEDYLFDLSPLLGIGATQAGFCFEVEREYIGNPKASDWKKFCQGHSLYNELSKIGFIQINNGNWFMPFKLNPDLLSEAYVTDTIVEALSPIVAVLNKIQEAHPLFEQLLADAEKKYSNGNYN
jgi:hypothetical protein